MVVSMVQPSDQRRTRPGPAAHPADQQTLANCERVLRPDRPNPSPPAATSRTPTGGAGRLLNHTMSRDEACRPPSTPAGVDDPGEATVGGRVMSRFAATVRAIVMAGGIVTMVGACTST